MVQLTRFGSKASYEDLVSEHSPVSESNEPSSSEANMIIDEFLAQLARKSIHLWAEGSNIRYTAPHGALSPQDIEILRSHKNDIVDILRRLQFREKKFHEPTAQQFRSMESPMSSAQSRLWFLHKLQPDSKAYNTPLLIEFDGKLDVEFLTEAIKNVVIRHESLRTIFSANSGGSQLVLPFADIKLNVLHRCVPDHDVETVSREFCDYSFSLDSEIPFRCLIAEVHSKKFYVTLLFHHIAFDGWSIQPLIDDLAAAYAALSGSELTNFRQLTLQYRDFADWQNELFSSGAFADQLSFWKDQLKSIPGDLALPFDRPRPDIASMSGARVPLQLSSASYAKLSAFARNNGATLFMALHALLAGFLNHIGAGADIPIGFPVGGRKSDKFENLIGLFLNTLVARVELSSEMTFIDVLTASKQACLGAYDHEDVPFEKVVETINPTRTLSRNPLFQVMLVFQGEVPAIHNFHNLKAQIKNIELPTAKVDLLFGFAQKNNQTSTLTELVGNIEYSTDLFD